MTPETAAPFADLLSRGNPVGASATTQAILKAAAAEFMEYGLRRTSVEAVAKRAGLSRITVYRRFPNKDALIRAVFVRECRQFIDSVEAALDPDATFENRVLDGFAAAMRLAANHAMTNRLMISDPEIVLPFLTTGGGPLLEFARDYMAREIRKAYPACAPQKASSIAETIMRLGLSFMLTRSGTVNTRDDASVREYARNVILPLMHQPGKSPLAS